MKIHSVYATWYGKSVAPCTRVVIAIQIFIAYKRIILYCWNVLVLYRMQLNSHIWAYVYNVYMYLPQKIPKFVIVQFYKTSIPWCLRKLGTSQSEKVLSLAPVISSTELACSLYGGLNEKWVSEWKFTNVWEYSNMNYADIVKHLRIAHGEGCSKSHRHFSLPIKRLYFWDGQMLSLLYKVETWRRHGPHLGNKRTEDEISPGHRIPKMSVFTYGKQNSFSWICFLVESPWDDPTLNLTLGVCISSFLYSIE